MVRQIFDSAFLAHASINYFLIAPSLRVRQFLFLTTKNVLYGTFLKNAVLNSYDDGLNG